MHRGRAHTPRLHGSPCLCRPTPGKSAAAPVVALRRGISGHPHASWWDTAPLLCPDHLSSFTQRPHDASEERPAKSLRPSHQQALEPHCEPARTRAPAIHNASRMALPPAEIVQPAAAARLKSASSSVNLANNVVRSFDLVAFTSTCTAVYRLHRPLAPHTRSPSRPCLSPRPDRIGYAVAHLQAALCSWRAAAVFGVAHFATAKRRADRRRRQRPPGPAAAPSSTPPERCGSLVSYRR